MQPPGDDEAERPTIPPEPREGRDRVPSTIGAYHVTGILGRGGLGVVYSAEDRRLQRRIAIKVLPPGPAMDPAGLVCIEREAVLLAAINHPNIATVYSLEQAEGLVFLTMELVAGETLAERITRGSMGLAQSLDIGRQIASALEAAHNSGVIHLDLKPANVKITRDDLVKLLDFGLARARALGRTGPGPPQDEVTLDVAIKGSPGYMSPEQLRGDRIDLRSDIWAFGCVLFEMMAGGPAFPGKTFPDRIAATLERPPDWARLSPKTPPRIRRLIERCLEKDLLHRLESMTAARRILEEEIAHQRPAEAVPLPVVDFEDHPTNLPLHLTSFVGRERPMDDLAQQLELDRLVTVTGPGGCGKTRLAREVGHRLLPCFPDGVWLVELAPYTGSDMVHRAVADALGVREDSRRSLADALRLHLKTRNLLLLLDNCEHLLEGSARLAEALLQTCPRIRILATSRERLGIVGEAVFHLAPLDVPDLKDLPPLAELERIESVRLFLDRAKAVDAGFSLTEENAPVLAQICRRLDGIPLALELAAARIGALPPEDIARRLDDRFHLLTTGSRTSLPRHQTLRALIDWSYHHLPETEQRLFRRLAVFAGGWSLEGVEEVCSGNGVERSEVVDLHSRLVERSLVEHDVVAGKRCNQVRYRALESIREYASEKLKETAEEEDLRLRHRTYYRALAVGSSAHLVGPEQREWSQRLEVEHENLRAAIDGAHAPGPRRDIGSALQIVASLGRYWYGRGRWTEGRSLMKAILDLPDAAARTASRAQALAWTGWIALWQGDLDEALSLNEESLAIRRELGDAMGIAQSLNNLGAIAQERGEFEKSREFHEESLAIRRSEGNLRYQAVSLHNIGELCYRIGKFKEARFHNEESLALRRKVGDLMGIADSLNALGMVAEQVGDLERARACYEESLANRQERDDPMGIAESLHYLAGIDAREGGIDRARESYAKSLATRRRLGDRLSIAESLESIGIFEIDAGEYGRGVRILAAAAALRAEIETPTSPARRPVVQAAIARGRENLGDPAFTCEWDRGTMVPLGSAIDFATSPPGDAAAPGN